MLNLCLAAAAFAGLHLLVSGTSLRSTIVTRVGEGPFRGLFSLATLGTLVWLTRSYAAAYRDANTFFWALPYAQHLAAPIVGLAFLLAVPGLASRSPTAVAGEALLARDPEPRGMQRITRHPFLWGVMIWSAFHMCANGDAASLVLFATLFVVAAVGTLSIDAKRARALGASWQTYLAQTSNLPFAAIARGRTRLVWSEIGAWRVLLAVVVLGVIVALHPKLFHAYAVPM